MLLFVDLSPLLMLQIYLDDSVLEYLLIGFLFCFFFQAEDGIRDLVRSRGLGDVYKRQPGNPATGRHPGGYPYAYRVGSEGAKGLVGGGLVGLSLIHI